MSTVLPDSLLAAALFGKARRAALAVLFSRTHESFYLSEIIALAQVGRGAVQRELRRLTRAGIVSRVRRGHQVFFQANSTCPLFAELRSIVVKTVGLGDMLREALLPLVDSVCCAFVYGSAASGEMSADSDVDVCIVGELSFAEAVTALGPVQERVGREVNPTVYPPTEFAAKLHAGHHFVASVARGPKVFLIGGEDELAGLAR